MSYGRKPQYDPDSDYEPSSSPLIKDYSLPKRPNYGGKGIVAKVAVNAYPVISYPSSEIYQYDCQIGADGSKRALITKLWNHPKLQEKFGKYKATLIFDGSKLAWSVHPLPFGDQLTMMIDLDEGGREPRPGKAPRDNKHRIVIRKTTSVPLQVLAAYLQGRTDYDVSVLAGINFLDHLVRQTPAKKFVAIKRSFFQRAGSRELEGGVEAWKGIFQSIRPAHGGRLIMNVDVATACFWKEGTLIELATNMVRIPNPEALANEISKQGPKGRIMRDLRRLKKVQFFCTHRLRDQDGSPKRIYTIEGYEEGNARNTKFSLKRRQTDGSETTREISVEDYYRTTYNIRLRYPGLPLIRTRKKGESYPMELCFVQKDQRYPFKLNEKQTADMIRFTVQRPAERQNMIRGNVDQLAWDKDPVLRDYGLQVSKKMIETEARVLPTPQIQYGPGSQDAKFTPRDGRWDLRGKKFASWGPISAANNGGLKAWGVMVFGSPQRIPEAGVKAFFRELIKAITQHGGHVVHKDPPIMYADANKAPGNNLFELYKKSGNKVNMKPQILFIILPAKSTQPYNDIKAYCDIQLGVPSQCMQAKHVEQAKQQYCSNICMKINAKMGGYSCDLVPAFHPMAKGPATMLLGADVSHASPSNPGTSYASMVGSTNELGTRFAAIANTNGTRTELISAKNVFKFVMTLLRAYYQGTKKKPDRIIYFRDGVSEGQYEQVIRVELEAIKQACVQMDPNYFPKFTVVICSKRHHFRFFPVDRAAQDRNANPVPGTLIEKDITSVGEYDFYLNSHSAIQGTSRPVHYQVIWDECKIPVDTLYGLIYNTCYTYIRATCSVSLVPATYYAHVASARARCHENDTEDHLSSFSPDDPAEIQRREQIAQGKVPPLRELHKDMTNKMWYI
ncbi:Piwi-domain-containing protein [Wilcoxina mikolae CBS 423.85]|nr:Piwi-domain-containing protein [Wilcoxina mikolae CBS 423.85]